MTTATTKPKTESKPAASGKGRYFYARGARKTAVAKVKLFTKEGDISVNGKSYKSYFPVLKHQHTVTEPLRAVSQELGAETTVKGGGISSQAEAVRLGIARALVKFNEIFKKRLRKEGFLTRDQRMVERKKYGLKKARRAPQWAKR